MLHLSFPKVSLPMNRVTELYHGPRRDSKSKRAHPQLICRVMLCKACSYASASYGVIKFTLRTLDPQEMVKRLLIMQRVEDITHLARDQKIWYSLHGEQNRVRNPIELKWAFEEDRSISATEHIESPITTSEQFRQFLDASARENEAKIWRPTVTVRVHAGHWLGFGCKLWDGHIKFDEDDDPSELVGEEAGNDEANYDKDVEL